MSEPSRQQLPWYQSSPAMDVLCLNEIESLRTCFEDEDQPGGVSCSAE